MRTICRERPPIINMEVFHINQPASRLTKNTIIKKALFHLLIFAVIAAAAAAYHFWIGSCPIRALLGVPCPTCGISRSAVALLHLDFRTSFRYHPLTIPLLPFVWFALHKNLFKLSKRAKNSILIAGTALVFAVYLIRLFMGIIP